MYKNLFSAVIILTFATTVFAKNVAVLPVNYVDADSGKVNSDNAKQVEDRITQGLVEAGFTPVKTTKPNDGSCNKECLLKAAESVNAEEAVLISIEDSEQTVFNVSVSFAKRDSITLQKMAGYYVFLEWIKSEIVKTMLLPFEDETVDSTDTDEGADSGEVESDTDASDAGAVESDTDEDTDDLGDDSVAANTENMNDTNPKKLGRLPFFIAAGSTVAFGITTLIIDGVAHSKYNTTMTSSVSGIKSDDEIKNDVKTIDNLQIARNVFLTFTAVGLVTTGILAIFTDFKKEKSSAKNRLNLTPALAGTDKSGFFILNGSF
jgi:hypothetical protein